MMRITLAVVSLLLLIGCEKVVFKEPYCGPLINYDQDFSNSLADEIASLDSSYYYIHMTLNDYINTRDQIRVCQEAK